MAKEGSKQVPVVGKEDKREITALLAVTASGTLLPPQLIYQGKTDGCHPKISFPADWNVTHSDSHWSTETTMLEYIDKVIVPYVVKERNRLELADDHPALAIFDGLLLIAVAVYWQNYSLITSIKCSFLPDVQVNCNL